MFALLLAPEVIVFSAALVLMLLIGVVEAFGLGLSGFDAEAGLDADAGGLLGWLGVGRVPLLILLVAYLAAFSVLGILLQQIAASVTGALLPPVLAVPAAMAGALLLGRGAARALARILPRDETTAIPLDALVGLTGRIVVGHAIQGKPARARVSDPHGQAHHVLVEPDHADAVFQEGDTILLVRRTDGHFRAIIHDSPRFSSWMNI